MIPAYCVLLLLLVSACWLACSGYTLADEETDADDMWPVLCPPDTFYSKKQDQCLPCSRCPMNKIITAECYGLHDTKCGPFYDFKDLIPSNEASSTKKKPEQLSNSAQSNHKSAVNSDILSDAAKNSNDELAHLEKISEDALDLTDSEWKSLTISLLVFISLFVVAIFMVAFCLYRRRVASVKKVVCEYSPPPEVV